MANETTPDNDQAVGDDVVAEENQNSEAQVDHSAGDTASLSLQEALVRLDAAEAKAAQNWDQVVRSQAEMDNLRKRQARDVENAREYGARRFAEELVPIRDSIELGLGAAQEEGADIVKIIEGYQLTMQQMDSAMQKLDITEINPQGEPFNPEHHQAMATEPNADVPANTVVKVYQKGWMLKERLLRPAMVVVSSSS